MAELNDEKDVVGKDRGNEDDRGGEQKKKKKQQQQRLLGLVREVEEWKVGGRIANVCKETINSIIGAHRKAY